MLGLKLSDLSMTWDDWSSRVPPDDMDSCLVDIKAHLEGKTDFYENMHRMRHADGSWVYILDRSRVVERDSEGSAQQAMNLLLRTQIAVIITYLHIPKQGRARTNEANSGFFY
ncbi:PAS domain-containing protein [Vibrio vulnificus]|uniref:PAS domain-containing protein n=1 Tax=Vibrio vulnificus TaxID=672 RepID=UPI00102939E6|nr:PAS domain-containing protein [Vibrio vulnificus]